MSKNINVNPDHYKVAGRERQGEDTQHDQSKRELALDRKAQQRQRERQAKKRSGTR